MNADLLAKILACPRLPSPPSIALKVIELCRSDESKSQEIAATIAADPALAAKLLKTANSSIYGLRQPVTTLRQAMVMLGLNAIKVLALGFSFLKSFEQGSSAGIDLSYLATRALYTAVGGQMIARAARIQQAEEVFVGGLLKDIGLLAMALVIDEEDLPVGKRSNPKDFFGKLEQEGVAGLTPADVGASLGERWHLPAAILTQIRYQSRPTDAPPELRPLVQAICAASIVAAAFLDNSPQGIAQFLARIDQWFRIPSHAGAQLVRHIAAGTKEVSQLVQLNIREPADAKGMIQEAQDLVKELAFRATQDTSRAA